MAADHAGRVDRVDRHLGQLISISGTLLLVGRWTVGSDEALALATWWHVAFASTMCFMLVNACFGMLLPMRVLRVGWLVTPLVGLAVGLLTFAAYHGPDPDALDPWQWAFASVFVGYLTLTVRPATAVACALLAGFVPVVSGLLVLGEAPTAAAQLTPIQMSNFAFAVIFAGIRARWLRHLELEASAREREQERRRAVAAAREHARVARLVHDEVLSTLSAAMRFRGSPPDQLRDAARDTLLILRQHPLPDGEALLAGATLVERLVEEARGQGPDWRIDASAEPGEVPSLVAETILAAATEAMRNSVQHAGEQVRRRELLARVRPDRIVVEITDDGAGFAGEAIAADRLGVRRSILGPLRALPGGAAEVRSRPGEGTEVSLTWQG